MTSAVAARPWDVAGKHPERRPWLAAAMYALALGAIFYSTYGFAEWAAEQRSHVPSMAFAWEHRVPFLPWTIVPYWSIDLFYCFSFFVCRTRGELDQHVKRLLLAQSISVVAFLLFPLRFSFVRPANGGLFGKMFDALASFDGPFNQAPSLHLSLAVILVALYSARLKGLTRSLLRAWFLLIGISALTTYQHHFIDVATGVWVGAFCCSAFSNASERSSARPESRHWKQSAAYCTGFLLLAFSATEIGGVAWLLLWPAGSCLILAVIYWKGDPGLFGKKGGKLTGAMRWLLAPHTALAWLNSRWWTRNEPATVEITEGVWLGRVPTRKERNAFGFGSIVDLSAELNVHASGIEYCNFPVLDLTVPSIALIQRAADAISRFQSKRPTLVCCALGYSRSATAMVAWLVRAGHATSFDDAIATLENCGRRIALSGAHQRRLQEWWSSR